MGYLYQAGNSKMKRVLCVMLLTLATGAPLLADEETSSPPAPVDQNGQVVEPEVTIREEEGRTIQEYRVNGYLYMVKIIPVHGKPYYLMDLDGDGKFDEVRGDDPGRIVLPQWILYRW